MLGKASSLHSDIHHQDTLVYPIDLDMSHVGLGELDEVSLLTIFGSCHSRYLTEGLPHNVNGIVDAGDNPLYPAYFMTHLRVPAKTSLSSFKLWDSVEVHVGARKYGDSILESVYQIREAGNSSGDAVTMEAASLFILDPAIYRGRERQVSVPAPKRVRDIPVVKVPPSAVQESARVRASGFSSSAGKWIQAKAFQYVIENKRDTSPGHPLMFAQFSSLIELSEKNYIRQITRGRLSEDALEDISLLERKIFYYGNAFAGSELVFHTRGRIEQCEESLWKDNPRIQYQYLFIMETEVYHCGECLALSKSKKVLAHQVHNQSRIQDTKRLFGQITSNVDDYHE